MSSPDAVVPAEPEAGVPATAKPTPGRNQLDMCRAACERLECGTFDGGLWICLRCSKKTGEQVVVKSGGSSETWDKGVTPIWKHMTNKLYGHAHFSLTDPNCDAAQCFPALWHAKTKSDVYCELVATAIATTVRCKP